MVLRNPSDKPQKFSITPKAALELPEGVKDKMTLSAVYPPRRQITSGSLDIGQLVSLTLAPFEVVVIELL